MQDITEATNAAYKLGQAEAALSYLVGLVEALDKNVASEVVKPKNHEPIQVMYISQQTWAHAVDVAKRWRRKLKEDGVPEMFFE